MWSAMVDYSIRILTPCRSCSRILVAAMLFFGLQRMIVQPLQPGHRWSWPHSVTAPRTARRTRRRNRHARTRSASSSSELATMRQGLRRALAEKTRLAALGAAMSRISHDLKNILATAVLISDRLGDAAPIRRCGGWRHA